MRKALVVIPTLNEALHIEACLQSIWNDLPSEWHFDFVVADGGSTDGTLGIVSALMVDNPNLSLSHNPHRLQSAAINRAVEERTDIDYQVLIRCDAHSSYPRRFLGDLIDKLEETRAASIVVPMDAKGTTTFSEATAFVIDTLIGSGGSRHRGGTASGYVDHGHHAAFDMQWFRKVGGYDASFSHNEDAEFDYRLSQAGGRIWLETSIRITYFMRPTLRGLARQYWAYGAGRSRTIAKHKMKPRLRQLVPVLNLLLLIVTCIAGMFWPKLWSFPALYMAFLCGFGIWTAGQMKRWAGLWASPALFFIHNAWAAAFIRTYIRNKRHN